MSSTKKGGKTAAGEGFFDDEIDEATEDDDDEGHEEDEGGGEGPVAFELRLEGADEVGAEEGVDEEVVKEVDGVAHHADGGGPAIAEEATEVGASEDAPKGKEQDEGARADFEVEVDEDEDGDPGGDAEEIGPAGAAFFAEVAKTG